MAKPEVKITITETGSEKAAAGIGRVDQAADKASKGGLKGLTDKIPGVNSALDRIPGGADLAAGGIGALGAASIAGGAALVGFAAKGVQAFAETTVEVGKFRDATGLTTDEASRLYEALGDLGVRPDEVAGAVGRLEKSLGTNKDAFKQFGLEVATTKDGMIDANGTFLNAIDALNRIEDPAKRAEAGAKIFGKGWQGMAEVIASGAPALRTALESVQPSKIFTDKDIQSGRDLRAGFDSIKDAGEGLLLTVGKSLAPSIAKLAPAFGDVIAKAEPLAEAFGEALGQMAEDLVPVIELVADLAGKLGDLGEMEVAPGVTVSDVNEKAASLIPFKKNLEDVKKAVDDLNKVDIQGQYVLGLTRGYEETQRLATETERLTAQATAYEKPGLAAAAATQTLANAALHADDAVAELKAETDKAAKKMDDLDDATSRARGELSGMAGEINADQSLINLENQIADVEDAGRDAMKAEAEAVAARNANSADAQVKAEAAEQAMRDYQTEVNNLKLDIINLGETAGMTPVDVQANLDRIDAGDLAGVRAAAEEWFRLHPVRAYTKATFTGDRGSVGMTAPEGATGGIVTRPTLTWVGEAGPEAVVPLNKTPGSSPLPAGFGGGAGVVNVTINTGLDPNAVATALSAYVRNGGRIPGLS